MCMPAGVEVEFQWKMVGKGGKRWMEAKYFKPGNVLAGGLNSSEKVLGVLDSGFFGECLAKLLEAAPTDDFKHT